VGDGSSVLTPGKVNQWIVLNNNTGTEVISPASFTFVLSEKNATDNQAHTVAVNLACVDYGDLGFCSVSDYPYQPSAQVAMIRVDVMTP
jgi:hypothetical protein